MKIATSLALILASLIVSAQPAAELALEKDSKTLNQRFVLMKEKSETFNEYKVIKEYILDGMWKITRDSLSALDGKVMEANDEANRLQQELNTALAAVKHKEESMADVEFASTHISVLGIDFGKNFFIGLVGAMFLGLLLLLGLATGRLKMMYQSLKDKVDAENLVSSEFETYKRKALEKQMRLSRELQDERNKLAELKSA